MTLGTAVFLLALAVAGIVLAFRYLRNRPKLRIICLVLLSMTVLVLAFINGKISLDEAEGVIDMINAESESELRAGSRRIYRSDSDSCGCGQEPTSCVTLRNKNN